MLWDYQGSDATNKINQFQIDYSTKKRNLSIETSSEEMKHEVMGKYEFEYRGKLIKQGFLRIFWPSGFWCTKKNP